MIDPFWRAFLATGPAARSARTISAIAQRRKAFPFTRKKFLPRGKAGEEWLRVMRGIARQDQFTVTDTGADGIPFAITTSVLAPVSAFDGTSKFVETVLFPVATPIVLWSCVLA